MSNNYSKISLAIAFLSFVLLFSLPSTALIQKYFGLIGVLSYVSTVTLILLFLLKLKSQIFSFVSKFYFAIVSFVIGFGILCFWILYPLENEGLLGIGSDRDEALNIAFWEFYARTISLFCKHSPRRKR